MGCWYFGCRSKFNDDRYICRSICNGGAFDFYDLDSFVSQNNFRYRPQGFLNLQWQRWKRVLFTRMIAIVPTFCVAFFSNIEDLTGMNDILNAVMALQLPFAVIPTIAFTSSIAIMGEFVNGLANKIVSIALCVVVIGINIFFVVDQVTSAELDWGWITLVSK